MEEDEKKLKIKNMTIETTEFGGDVTWKRSKQVAVKLKRMNSETWKVGMERWIGIKTG